MKQRYVPLEKKSKREQREQHSARRGSWGGVNPVTRKPPNPKAYTRKKSGQRYDHEPLSGFYFQRVRTAAACENRCLQNIPQAGIISNRNEVVPSAKKTYGLPWVYFAAW